MLHSTSSYYSRAIALSALKSACFRPATRWCQRPYLLYSTKPGKVWTERNLPYHEYALRYYLCQYEHIEMVSKAQFISLRVQLLPFCFADSVYVISSRLRMSMLSRLSHVAGLFPGHVVSPFRGPPGRGSQRHRSSRSAWFSSARRSPYLFPAAQIFDDALHLSPLVIVSDYPSGVGPPQTTNPRGKLS